MHTNLHKLGVRHVCSGCGCRYYDFGKSNPTCPRCASQPPSELGEDPRAVAMARLKEEAKKPKSEKDEAPAEPKADPATEEDEEDEEDAGVEELGELTLETSDATYGSSN